MHFIIDENEKAQALNDRIYICMVKSKERESEKGSEQQGGKSNREYDENGKRKGGSNKNNNNKKNQQSKQRCERFVTQFILISKLYW